MTKSLSLKLSSNKKYISLTPLPPTAIDNPFNIIFLNVLFYLFFFKHLFIWLHWVFIAALGNFHLCYGMQDLQLQHMNSQLQQVGSSSLTRDQSGAPCIGDVEFQPQDHQGSPPFSIFTSFFFSIEALLQYCTNQFPCSSSPICPPALSKPPNSQT